MGTQTFRMHNAQVESSLQHVTLRKARHVIFRDAT